MRVDHSTPLTCVATPEHDFRLAMFHLGWGPIRRIFADGGYAGKKMALVVWRTGAWKLEIVKRSDAKGFEVLEMDR